MPDALSAYREEIKVAFGKELRYVSPTVSRFDIFAGVQLRRSPSAIHVNSRAEKNLTTIAGHELYHTLERKHQGLHAGFRFRLNVKLLREINFKLSYFIPLEGVLNFV